MLEISGIDVYYNELRALSGVSLAVKKGEIVALVGSNGAGKSTILRTICGFLRPRCGDIKFKGSSISSSAVHSIAEAGISMVPEEKRVFREMTVFENLKLGSFMSKARQGRDETFGRIYEMFPVLKQRSNQKAGTLSGGEQQMLIIGRALMCKPELLLLDDISFGLSPIMVKGLFKVVKKIHQTMSITILLVEQNVRLALQMANRAYIIENGSIIKEGSSSEFLSSKSIKDAYFGVSTDEC